MRFKKEVLLKLKKKISKPKSFLRISPKPPKKEPLSLRKKRNKPRDYSEYLPCRQA
jgi:hypothetical protein